MGINIETYVPTGDKDEAKKFATIGICSFGEAEDLIKLIHLVSDKESLGIKHLTSLNKTDKRDPDDVLKEVEALRGFIKSGKKPNYIKGKDIETDYEFYFGQLSSNKSAPRMLDRILNDIELICKHAKKYGLKVYFT